MSEIYFVDVFVALSRPSRIITPGKTRREVLRRLEVSLPIRDKVRAEQLLEHLAKNLAAVFKEVETHDQSIRQQTSETDRRDGGRADGSGDQQPDTHAPPVSVEGPNGYSGDAVDGGLPPRIDGQSPIGKEAVT